MCEQAIDHSGNGINVKIQQDGGEFLYQFIDRLESIFSGCADTLKCKVITQLVYNDQIRRSSDRFEPALKVDVLNTPTLEAALQKVIDAEH